MYHDLFKIFIYLQLCWWTFLRIHGRIQGRHLYPQLSTQLRKQVRQTAYTQISCLGRQLSSSLLRQYMQKQQTHIVILPECSYETGAACVSVANPSKHTHTPPRRASILSTAANPLPQPPTKSFYNSINNANDAWTRSPISLQIYISISALSNTHFTSRVSYVVSSALANSTVLWCWS